ncbi:MAG: methyltransferase domain-containing protein, partial [Candidatus Methylomirabilis sp.]|nr:methyltransferase domain-containing protein [Deltaproteobacteria bacterium]
RSPRSRRSDCAGDAYALDFPDASFDLFFNGYMFDLLPEADFPKVIAEFKRVLAPGGRLAMVNLAKAGGVLYAAWEAVYRVAPSLLGGCRGVEVVPPLEAAGFKVETREFVTQWGFPSEVILARR